MSVSILAVLGGDFGLIAKVKTQVEEIETLPIQSSKYIISRIYSVCCCNLC